MIHHSPNKKSLLWKNQKAYEVKQLEFRGSSYILHGNFRKGLHLWKEASKTRSDSRDRIPETEIPPVVRKFLKSEWIDYCDVVQMEQELATPRGQLNLINQAMLIRSSCIRDGNDGIHLMNLFDGLQKAMHFHVYDWINFAVSVFAWLHFDQDMNSIPLNNERTCSLIREIIDHFTEVSSLSEHESQRHLACFENCMLILKWLVASIEDFQSNLTDKSRGHISGIDSLMECTLDLLVLMYSHSMTNDQQDEFEESVVRLALVDLCNSKGRNLLMLAIQRLPSSDFILYDDLRALLEQVSSRPEPEHQISSAEKMVQHLIDYGANSTQTDRMGNNCMDLLKENNGQLKSWRTAQRLLKIDYFKRYVYRNGNRYRFYPLAVNQFECLCPEAVQGGQCHHAQLPRYFQELFQETFIRNTRFCMSC